MYCKALSRDFLWEVGFRKVYKDEEGNWVLIRHWYDNNKKTKSWHTIKITEARTPHKYRPDKIYPKVTFSARGYGMFSIPLNRFLFVWFKRDLEDGEVVDHQLNDPFNNDPDNLEAMSISDNLAKRFSDNPEAWTNQWGKQKGYKKE